MAKKNKADSFNIYFHIWLKSMNNQRALTDYEYFDIRKKYRLN